MSGSESFLASFDHAMSVVAPRLAALSTPDPNATAHYEIMSDALWWSDEYPSDTEAPDSDELSLEFTRAMGYARLIIRHRTCLMLGLGNQYEPFWRRGLQLFPAWVAFRPERLVRTDALAHEYALGSRYVRRTLKRCDSNHE